VVSRLALRWAAKQPPCIGGEPVGGQALLTTTSRLLQKSSGSGLCRWQYIVGNHFAKRASEVGDATSGQAGVGFR